MGELQADLLKKEYKEFEEYKETAVRTATTFSIAFRFVIGPFLLEELAYSYLGILELLELLSFSVTPSFSLLVPTVTRRPICHGRAQPVLIVPGVDGVLGAPGVDMDVHC